MAMISHAAEDEEQDRPRSRHPCFHAQDEPQGEARRRDASAFAEGLQERVGEGDAKGDDDGDDVEKELNLDAIHGPLDAS